MDDGTRIKVYRRYFLATKFLSRQKVFTKISKQTRPGECAPAGTKFGGKYNLKLLRHENNDQRISVTIHEKESSKIARI